MRSLREADDPTTFRNIQFEIRGLGREAMRRATDVQDSGHTYTTRSGDTLWGIARHHLGGGARWVKIFALNCVDMRHGDILATGATLKMPKPYVPGGG
jgi:nucleoid-associated protein YgaU